MPEEGADNSPNSNSLLAPDEPPPFAVLNKDSTRPILLVCDHASRRFPRSLGSMGVDPAVRRCHLALDIGAAGLTERLAKSLGATAVMCRYSRLIVDCNRELMDPGAFLEFGDGVVIPGNRNLRADEKARRADAIFWPYHRAIDKQIERLSAAGPLPVLVSIHSFTPVMNGEFRSWEMGVLWDKDRATAKAFIDGLRSAGYLVGDNEPYSGKAPQDFTIDHHAEAAGLPHVGIEVRQDLIYHEDGVDAVGKVLDGVIGSLSIRVASTGAAPRQSPISA